MKTIRSGIIITVLGVGLLGGANLMAQRNYDPKTVETVTGKVLSLEKRASSGNRGYGVHLTLQTSKNTIAVHLGPAWYIEKKTPSIGVNDTVTVTGSRVAMDGRPVLIAAQVKKGNDILKLRNESGVPLWSGRGGKNR